MEVSFKSLDNWTNSVDALARNTRAKYRELKRDGVTSMSLANLRQIVSTQGVNVAPGAFDRCLEHAIERADIPKGFVR